MSAPEDRCLWVETMFGWPLREGLGIRDLKEAMGAKAAGMDGPLRGTLVVEMEDPFAEGETFEQKWGR